MTSKPVDSESKMSPHVALEFELRPLACAIYQTFSGGLPASHAESEAPETPTARPSSPEIGQLSTSSPFPDEIPFKSLPELPEDMPEDFDYMEPSAPAIRRSGMTLEQKTWLVLQWIVEIPHFSLALFADTLFTSNLNVITPYANRFLSQRHHIGLMNAWLHGSPNKSSKKSTRDAQSETADWVIESATSLCAREASFVTENSQNGPFKTEAASLRVSAHKITVETVKNFRVPDLEKTYERTLPRLQKILKSVVGGEDKAQKKGSCNVNHGRTLSTSILLNLRSRRTNHHAVMNTFLMWKARVPKRFLMAMNRYGVATSHPFQCRAIVSLSKDAIVKAQTAAIDPEFIKVLPYDNFNWVNKTFEATALHGAIQHDQVSALLMVVEPIGAATGMSAAEIADVKSFKETETKRHDLPPAKSLSDILPSLEDHGQFRFNAILHVAHILAEEVPEFSWLTDELPKFSDPSSLPTAKTKEFYLPTFDQEQGSTRGNMLVLEHYFTKVLKIPKRVFDKIMHLVLGDRLTTVRDRAAQDQRSVDTSEDVFDHLSSFAMISGLMHFILNFIQAIGGAFWGSTSKDDPLSLHNLRDQLPNRQDIQLKKVDYYAWLWFLDVILRGLTLRASCVIVGVTASTELSSKLKPQSAEDLQKHATSIVDHFLSQSTSRLEETGVKTVPGNSVNSNATLLLFNLVLLREMQDSVKRGHPTRITRMLKFWLLTFYASGSYNYANETMELLHNVIHDWPKPFADVALSAMLVNPHGKHEDWKPTDIRVEHLNDDIKEHAHGPNATPELLEKITPAIGYIDEYIDTLFQDLGVEAQNQKHIHVSQRRDVQLLLQYFTKHSVFDFAHDRASSGQFSDLFKDGKRRLSGPQGGHAKHLLRHSLRFRSRHHESTQLPPKNLDAFQELEIAKDATKLPSTAADPNAWDDFTLAELIAFGEEMDKTVEHEFLSNDELEYM
ncbi:hypothetical protein BKA70DRAFT_1573928 [Coprinopsis sp. MPI-PUGE-AT-0042]|nr:hypothetical protein BKA70DRAFT_1573928 [Coprinopsis sp. MPI-PUGE-AT-0042]